MKKYFLFLFVATLFILSTPVFAQTKLEPRVYGKNGLITDPKFKPYILNKNVNASSTLSTSTPKANLDAFKQGEPAACFDYYTFGSIKVNLSTDKDTYNPGSPVFIRGQITNDNRYPITNLTIRARLVRDIPNPVYLRSEIITVEDFIIAENLTLNASSSFNVKYSHLIPLNAPKGGYKLLFYAYNNDRFNQAGLSFTNDVVATSIGFIVAGNNPQQIYLDQTKITLNDQIHNVMAFMTNHQKDKVINISIPLANPSDKSETMTVTYNLYKWDGLLEENKVDTKTQTVTVPAKGKVQLTYKVEKTDSAEYFLNIKADNATQKKDKSVYNIKTESNIRFIVSGYDYPRINSFGVDQYPIKKGEESTLFTCYHNGAAKNTSNEINISTILYDNENNIISQSEYNGKMGGDIRAIIKKFKSAKDLVDFKIITTVSDDRGNLIDKIENNYNCKDIDPSKCPSKLGYLWVVLISILILVVGFIFVLRRKRNIKSIPTLMLFTLIFFASIFLGVKSTEAAVRTDSYATAPVNSVYITGSVEKEFNFLKAGITLKDGGVENIVNVKEKFTTATTPTTGYWFLNGSGYDSPPMGPYDYIMPDGSINYSKYSGDITIVNSSNGAEVSGGVDSPVEVGNVVIESSDNNVVTCDSGGCTAVAEGTAVITVSFENRVIESPTNLMCYYFKLQGTSSVVRYPICYIGVTGYDESLANSYSGTGDNNKVLYFAQDWYNYIVKALSEGQTVVPDGFFWVNGWDTTSSGYSLPTTFSSRSAFGYATAYGTNVFEDEGGSGYSIDTFSFSPITYTITVPPIPNVPQISACSGVTNIGADSAKVNWTYSDTDGDPQTSYQVDIALDSAFTNIVKSLVAPANTDVSATRSVDVYGLGTSTRYYSRIKTFNDTNSGSEWGSCGSFTTLTPGKCGATKNTCEVGGYANAGENSEWTWWSCLVANNTLTESFCTSPKVPTVNLMANPTNGVPPLTPTLTWSVTGTTTSCTAGNGWTGSKNKTGGSETVATTSTAKTYTLYCSNSTGNSNTASVTVTPTSAYTITFNKNDSLAQGAMQTQAMFFGKETKLSENGFTKPGYTFDGWAETAGGEKVYENGALYTIGVSNVTLYAKWISNAYLVKFNKCDNSATGSTADQTIPYGGSAPLTKNGFSKTGWAFAGWATACDGSPKVYDDGAMYTIGISNVTLYAKWTQNGYNIIFTKSDSAVQGSMVDQIIPYANTEPLKANLFTKPGYKFTGWSLSNNNIPVYVDMQNYQMTQTWSKILYTCWEKEQYTITYNKCDGSAQGAMPDKMVGAYDYTALSKNLFTKTGWTFAGWATTIGGNKVYNDLESLRVMSNMNLCAKWTQNSYNVTFDKNSSTASGVAMTAQVIPYGNTATLKSNTFTNTGKTFAGWAETSGGAVKYGNGTAYTMNNIGGETLFAVWTNNYVVTFSSGGAETGANPSAKIITPPATTVGTLPNEPQWSAHTFVKWTTQSNCAGNTFNANTEVGGNITVYACYSSNSYTITFNKADGSAVGSMSAQSVPYGERANLLKNQFTKTGWTFAGWAETEGGNVVYADGALYKYMPANNVTLYAKWTQNSFTITFDKADDSATGSMMSQSIPYGNTQNLRANGFTKAGWAFAGWSKSQNGGGIDYPDGAPYTVDTATGITLYARWVQGQYTITFSKNDDSAYGSMTNQIIGSGLTAILKNNTFQKTGWKFDGWATTPSGNVEYVNGASYVIGSSNVALYAKWTQNVYSVALTASPTSGTAPMETVLSWVVSGFTSNSCTASGAWNGTKTGASGNTTISNIFSNSIFTLTCADAEGSASASANVTVLPGPECSVTKNTCEGGAFTDLEDQSPNFLWKCSLNGKDKTCYAPMAYGTCGSAHGIERQTPPTTYDQLCFRGEASSVASTTSVYTWTCSEDFVANCFAPKSPDPVPAMCGPADRIPTRVVPVNDLCLVGTSTAVSNVNANIFTWDCNNDINVSCSAPKATISICQANGVNYCSGTMIKDSCDKDVFDCSNLEQGCDSGVCMQTGTKAIVSGEGSIYLVTLKPSDSVIAFIKSLTSGVKSCSLDGVSIPRNTSKTFYSSRMAQVCSPQAVWCNSGDLSANSKIFRFKSCVAPDVNEF